MAFGPATPARLTTLAALAAVLSAPALADDHEGYADVDNELVPQDQVIELADDPEIGSRISGVIGADIYSHFVSYGQDVWAEGDAFSGSDTLNPYAEIGIAFDGFDFAVGLWGDVNDNAPESIGGNIQEIDFYLGVSKSFGDLTAGVTYQAWQFGGGTEHILDISLGYDDAALWGDSGFTLAPSLTIHNRIGNTANEGVSDSGTVLVFGAELPIGIPEDFPVSVSFPVALGIVLEEDYFIDGGDSGLGFFSAGASFGYSLNEIIDPSFGDWSLNAGVTVYVTEEDVYQNPEDTFVVYNFGASMAF